MKIKGITLLELLVTMLLLFGLSIIAIASYAYLLQKNEQQVIIDELKSAIRYAKIQAIIRGIPVSLIPLNNSLNWADGMVLSTLNKKTNKMELIYQWQWRHPYWRLDWSGVNTLNKISFSNNPTQAISNGRFTLINTKNHKQVAIILNRLGRIRISNNLSQMS
jgi:Tfp pilus assembly protein FimT